MLNEYTKPLTVKFLLLLNNKLLTHSNSYQLFFLELHQKT